MLVMVTEHRRILTLGFSWLVMCCRLHALADIVMGKMPPVPTEQEADGTHSGYVWVLA